MLCNLARVIEPSEALSWSVKGSFPAVSPPFHVAERLETDGEVEETTEFLFTRGLGFIVCWKGRGSLGTGFE